MTTKRPTSQPSTLAERVKARLGEFGVVELPKPSLQAKELDIPRCGITAITPEALGTLNANYAAVIAYVGCVVGDMEVECISREHAMNVVRSRVLATLRSDESLSKVSVSEKKALADSDPEVVEARGHLIEAEATLKKMASVWESYRTVGASLSREITRRVKALEPSAPDSVFGEGGLGGGSNVNGNGQRFQGRARPARPPR